MEPRPEAPIEIRAGERVDHEKLFELQKAADLAAFPHIYPPEIYPFPDAVVLERWKENLMLEDRQCLVAESDGRLIGSAVLMGHVFDSIAVVPDKWGTGVATLLHDAMISLARLNGIEALDLWVLEQNFRARHFYEKHGWRPTGETKSVSFPPHPQLVAYQLDRW